MGSAVSPVTIRYNNLMEKRLIFAIALSMLVLLTWSMLAPKPPETKIASAVAAKTAITAETAQKPEKIAPLAEPAPQSLEKITFGKRESVFIEPWAAIKEVNFKDFQTYKFELKNRLTANLKRIFNKDFLGVLFGTLSSMGISET